MLRLISIFTLSVLLLSCSSGHDTTSVTIDDLAGLWNSSESHGAKKDIIYTRVSKDGGIVEYDFDGDEFDQGIPCYQVNTGTVTHIADNRFMVTADMFKDRQFEVELVWLDAGYALKIYFLDADSNTVQSQIWTRESDQAMLDSEPSCNTTARF